MTERIISLVPKAETADPAAVASVMRQLEALTALARAGEITGLATAVLFRNGSYDTGFTVGAPYSRMLGAVTHLSHRLFADN